MSDELPSGSVSAYMHPLSKAMWDLEATPQFRWLPRCVAQPFHLAGSILIAAPSLFLHIGALLYVDPMHEDPPTAAERDQSHPLKKCLLVGQADSVQASLTVLPGTCHQADKALNSHCCPADCPSHR